MGRNDARDWGIRGLDTIEVDLERLSGKIERLRLAIEEFDAAYQDLPPAVRKRCQIHIHGIDKKTN